MRRFARDPARTRPFLGRAGAPKSRRSPNPLVVVPAATISIAAVIGELAGPTWVLRVLVLALAGLLIYAATLFRSATRAHLALLATGLILPILLIWLLARPDVDEIVTGRSLALGAAQGTATNTASVASPSRTPSATARSRPQPIFLAGTSIWRISMAPSSRA